jgi:hypothetical protein
VILAGIQGIFFLILVYLKWIPAKNTLVSQTIRLKNKDVLHYCAGAIAGDPTHPMTALFNIYPLFRRRHRAIGTDGADEYPVRTLSGIEVREGSFRRTPSPRPRGLEFAADYSTPVIKIRLPLIQGSRESIREAGGKPCQRHGRPTLYNFDTDTQIDAL